MVSSLSRKKEKKNKKSDDGYDRHNLLAFSVSLKNLILLENENMDRRITGEPEMEICRDRSKRKAKNAQMQAAYSLLYVIINSVLIILN